MSMPVLSSSIGRSVAAPSAALIADETSHSARTPHTIKVLIVCGVLLVAAIVVVTTILVSDLRHRALTDHERELRNITLVIAEQANRAFQAVELVQTSIVDRVQSLELASAEELRRHMSGHDAHLMLNDKVRGLTYVRDFALFDSEGQLINSGREWPIADLNIAEKAHFSRFKENPQLTSWFTMPQHERTIGDWAFYLVRRLSAPNGDFLGLVVATIDLQRWESFFGSIALGNDSAIALFRNDGVLLVRYPRIEWSVGKVFSSFLNALGDRDSASTRFVSKMEGKDRLLAAHRLANYPLITTATYNVSDVLAGWQHQAQFVIGSGIAAALVIGVILLLIVRQLKQAHWQAQRLLVQRQWRLDTALNNMSLGLCMFDGGARLVVCNERYLQMYGLCSEKVRAGLPLVDLLEQRRRAGNFTGDTQQYCSELLGRITRGTIHTHLIGLDSGRVIQIINRPMAGGGWVATHEDVTEQKQAEGRIARMARHDALTDLGNRLLFWEMIDQARARLQRNGESFAVLLLDLDEFKTVNDSLGHPVGDELIKGVAQRLRRVTRNTDTVARLGGDEFAILQSVDRDQKKAAIALATRILEIMAAPFELAGQNVVVGVSIGIALAPEDDVLADQLLKKADLALYRAKAAGRNGFHFFEPAMEAQARLRHALGTDLRAALSAEEFEVLYQPIIDGATQGACGVEALLRWRHPERGVIAPDAFISIAEDTGLIIPLGEWVLRKACKDATRWPAHVKLAVNLSPAQFRKGNLFDVVKAALVDSGLSPDRLELEITESVLMQKNSDSLATLHRIRSLGVSIVLDDFGTGYASLSYLRMFRFDKIKIDRSFVAEMSSRADCSVIIRAITEVGRRLNITTTAEGVETEEQLGLLRAVGCDQMQGYLFGYPRPASELNLVSRVFQGAAEAPVA